MNLANTLKNINNSTLDDIDMSDCRFINSKEYIEYFIDLSSKEHYRLLCYLSNTINNCILIDIGTLKGCSALALSANKTNTVYSFNISDQLDLNTLPKNVFFIIDEIINEKYKDIILKSKIILLDTFHDGVYEKQFMLYLKNIQYKGLILLDDILLNSSMKEFWKNIDLPKLDLTHIGHSTGTGAVFFD